MTHDRLYYNFAFNLMLPLPFLTLCSSKYTVVTLKYGPTQARLDGRTKRNDLKPHTGQRRKGGGKGEERGEMKSYIYGTREHVAEYNYLL